MTIQNDHSKAHLPNDYLHLTHPAENGHVSNSQE